MKICSTCGILKSLDQYAIYVSGTDGHRTRCKSCDKEYQKQYHLKHGETRRKAMSRNYQENKPAYHIRSAKWKKENPETVSLQMFDWRMANSHVVAALASKRRASRIQATPKWADEKAIQQYYLIAGFLSVELGTEFEVDHVVPLQSKLVCGLHVHTNLSIMLKPVNLRKGNRHWPDMPCISR